MAKVLTWISAFKWASQIFGYLQEAIFGEEEKKFKKENERYNYGYGQSLREIWAQSSYNRYFQKLDKDMYLKLVQQKLIDGITDSLESRGISTEMIKERSTQILNSGVIVTGGNIQAENFAVGKGASAIKGATDAAKGFQRKFQGGAKK